VARAGAVALRALLPVPVLRTVEHAEEVPLPAPALALRTCVPDREAVPHTEPPALADAEAERDAGAEPQALAVGECDVRGLLVAWGALTEPLGVAQPDAVPAPVPLLNPVPLPKTVKDGEAQGVAVPEGKEEASADAEAHTVGAPLGDGVPDTAPLEEGAALLVPLLVPQKEEWADEDALAHADEQPVAVALAVPELQGVVDALTDAHSVRSTLPVAETQGGELPLDPALAVAVGQPLPLPLPRNDGDGAPDPLPHLVAPPVAVADAPRGVLLTKEDVVEEGEEVHEPPLRALLPEGLSEGAREVSPLLDPLAHALGAPDRLLSGEVLRAAVMLPEALPLAVPEPHPLAQWVAPALAVAAPGVSVAQTLALDKGVPDKVLVPTPVLLLLPVSLIEAMLPLGEGVPLTQAVAQALPLAKGVPLPQALLLRKGEVDRELDPFPVPLLLPLSLNDAALPLAVGVPLPRACPYPRPATATRVAERGGAAACSGCAAVASACACAATCCGRLRAAVRM
jgi:hypothetical protein